MDHREQYKKGGASVDDLRDKKRQEDSETRKDKRDQLLDSKRVRIEQAYPGYDDVISPEQVKEAAENLIKKSEDRKGSLITIRRGFARNYELIDVFLSVENAMASLVGILSGSETALQMEAAWCLTNMAAGMHNHAALVLKHAGPYLVTYLSSGNAALQDQCAWAIANLAGDSDRCRETLMSQGVIPPLINLLANPLPTIVQSTAFALSNLARGTLKVTQEMLSKGILAALLRVMTPQNTTEHPEVVSEVLWVLTHMAASNKLQEHLIAGGTLDVITTLIVHQTEVDPTSYLLLTPQLRILGNLCSDGNEAAEEACKHEGLVPALGVLMSSKYIHIKKECLWLLSNITAAASVCQLVMTHGLIEKITPLLASTRDFKREAAYCMCNLASQGEDFCKHMLSCDVVPGMVLLLRAFDSELAYLALAFTDQLLQFTGSQGRHIFEEAGGLAALEALVYHDNQPLQCQASSVMEKYFTKEDTEEMAS